MLAWYQRDSDDCLSSLENPTHSLDFAKRINGFDGHVCLSAKSDRYFLKNWGINIAHLTVNC